MRDPYANVKDAEYNPLTYTIASIVSPQDKSKMVVASHMTSTKKAVGKVVEGLNKIDQSFRKVAAAIPKAV
ncbi:hypothetical protein SEA_SCHWARTZ33_52 [Gordonia phage Schwartz33]|nr:hypothetical protein SEA_SCHWARTZ33_52 [Gordonia phage Schwartz33]